MLSKRELWIFALVGASVAVLEVLLLRAFKVDK